jgi:eukaryotic-like serine/threonine-protein kinase
MIGTKIAHYQITAHLGSGGMGQVYEATDSKLHRQVAIKVLPEGFANDIDRVARFEREARVLASLNHPHIASVYGFEESEGRNYLVMELVPGETLSQRIGRGRLPLDEALPIAKQIAEALEAAAEKGLVHRDLKPGNIKIDPDGHVKLLDFGLAKAFATESTSTNLSNSPTLSAAATNAGVILGTPSYMSPEQARGATVDPRTDIFAFGCVLFEMLTGRQAFPGENVSDIVAAILKTEPDWNQLPAETPAAIRRLLQRCLHKDRRQRLQSAGDARLEIEETLAEPGALERTVGPATFPRRERIVWLTMVAAAVAAAAVFAFLYFRRPAELPQTFLEVTTPATPDPISLAISPDGRQLAFVAYEGSAQRLWVRRLDSAMSQPIAGSEGASYPFWSPDSRSIGFFAAGKLRRLDLGAGQPRILAEAAEGRGGTWNADDVILFSPRPGAGLFRVSGSGGDAVAINTAPSTRFPQFLPSGRQFIFLLVGVDVQPEKHGAYLGSLDSPQTKFLARTDTAAKFMAPDWLLFTRGGTLVAQHFDISRGEVTGNPIVVADAVSLDLNVFATAVSVSTAGVVAYRSGNVPRRQLMWFDRSGLPGDRIGASDENDLLDAELSPDGRQVAIMRLMQNIRSIWLVDPSRGILTRFTDESANTVNPRWLPDGKRISFQSNRKENMGIYIRPSAGPAGEELLTPSGLPEDWSPDGRFLAFTKSDPNSLNDIWIQPLEGDRKPSPFANTKYDEVMAQFSPDGRWIAYRSNESGRPEVYVQAFPGPGSKVRVSTDGGTEPRWNPNGKELFYISPDAKMIAASVTSSSSGLEIGKPVPLFQTRIVRGGTSDVTQQYDVSHDGRFLINVPADEAVTSPVTLLFNWKPRAVQ